MFDTMAFNCSFFPDVDGIITGVYNGRHKGYSRSELLKKYVNIILNINSTFDSEFISKINGFFSPIISILSSSVIFNVKFFNTIFYFIHI